MELLYSPVSSYPCILSFVISVNARRQKWHPRLCRKFGHGSSLILKYLRKRIYSILLRKKSSSTKISASTLLGGLKVVRASCILQHFQNTEQWQKLSEYRLLFFSTFTNLNRVVKKNQCMASWILRSVFDHSRWQRTFLIIKFALVFSQ